MTLADMALSALQEAKRPRLSKSAAARAERGRQRRKLKGTLVTLTVNDLLKYVRNRKSLLGSEMGDMRVFKITRTVPNVNGKQFIVHGESRGTELYKTSVSFFSVNYSDEKDKEHPLTVNLSFGKEAFMQQLKSNSNPIQVRCTCKDFEFRWAFYDKKRRALLGRSFPAYQRKTTTYPEVNPAHVPGWCKHVLQAINRLKKDRILI